MARRYYIDTSAYLCILLGQAGHEALQRELSGGTLLTSSLFVLEAYRTLVRLSRDRLLSSPELQSALDRLESDLDQFVLRDLTLDLSRSRIMPVVSTPRSLDLVHLRTALWFHERQPLDRFVGLDEPQNIAARELGLPV
jgi:hypothetical protein